MKTERKYELDDTLRILLIELNDTNNAFREFLKGGIFWRPKVRDIEAFLSVVSTRRSGFWNTVYKRWPELRDKRISANHKEITVL